MSECEKKFGFRAVGITYDNVLRLLTKAALVSGLSSGNKRINDFQKRCRKHETTSNTLLVSDVCGRSVLEIVREIFD